MKSKQGANIAVAVFKITLSVYAALALVELLPGRAGRVYLVRS